MIFLFYQEKKSTVPSQEKESAIHPWYPQILADQLTLFQPGERGTDIMPTTLLLPLKFSNLPTALFKRKDSRAEENLAWMPVSLALYLGLKTKQQLSSGGVPRRRGVNKDGAGRGAIVPPDFGKFRSKTFEPISSNALPPSRFSELPPSLVA